MIILLIVAISAAFVTGSAELSALASLDVLCVRNGELWRLFSGHLAHLSWRQYAIDTSVFILLYATYGKRAGASIAVTLSLFAALSVSVAVVVLGMHQVYGGLSGLTCAALSAILLSLISERPRRAFPYLMSLIYIIYLVYLSGYVSGVKVAHEAHMAGAISGLGFALFHELKSSRCCRE